MQLRVKDAPTFRGRPPFGLKWRSSYWLTTFVVGLGILTDLLVSSVIIPVMPFQLQKLGYSNVSSLIGWLLFAYSAGLLLATVPIAMFSERYSARQMPLVIGLIILTGSQIMLMEARLYAVMCIARLLQGVGSSMIWVVGLALLYGKCDATPEIFIGRQLGIAMAGMSIGILVGPPVGGAVYSRFGFRGPFIFLLLVIFLDFIGRIIVIERKDAILWGVDPTAVPGDNQKPQELSSSGGPPGGPSDGPPPLLPQQLAAAFPNQVSESDGGSTNHRHAATAKEQVEKTEINTDCLPVCLSPEDSTGLIKPSDQAKASTSLLTVIRKLAMSPSALVTFFGTFVYGFVQASQEPSIPLHLQSVWKLNSGQVGLVFLAAAVPTLFSSTLTGLLVDRLGPAWITIGALILSLPWWGALVITGPLALFIVSFALEVFFFSAMISPLLAELARVSQAIEGVGYAHMYGAFNIAYAIGAALGPVAGGQIYGHVKHGWTAQCLLAMGLITLTLSLTFFFTGNDPLFRQLSRWLKGTPELPCS